MKKSGRIQSLLVAVVAAVAAFIALTVFNGGLIEVSRDVAFLEWVRDSFVYSVAYKLGYKLVASAMIGCFAYFVSAMTAYGKTVSAKKRARIARVSFAQKDSDVGRTA